MKNFKKLLFGPVIILAFSSCSVQQFAVNTMVQPFENGGKIFGEKTQGKEFAKSGDLHILGFNIQASNTNELVQSLNANSYTIESKSNLYLYLLTGGIVDYKIVKVIKRTN
ncbi:hypothetical protein [Adhaeribacter aquaticus]|uniref:hypothetical protein n=1 Tax=Adhaeribacter aquaticus TaxID=299567 RepID=UPI0012FC9D01|nr:hypothetical protein [Adhaeribacter aquaticus]